MTRNGTDPDMPATHRPIHNRQRTPLPTAWPWRVAAALAFATLLAPTRDALAHDCTLNDVAINPDNGASYAGKSGIIRCRDEDGFVRQDEVRDGRFVGFQRHRDVWNNVTERTIDDQGNTEGVEKTFYPDGKLQAEATYRKGGLIGTARSFHRDGTLKRIAHYPTAGSTAAAALTFDARGRLESLTCGERSYLPEDKEPCGFSKPVQTVLHRQGRPAERIAYAHGKATRHEQLDAAGKVEASAAVEDGMEVRRTFHPDGHPASESRYRDGALVSERTWYMNGQLQKEVRQAADGRRSDVVNYRDDGTLAETETLDGRRRTTWSRHDASGRLRQTDDFDAEGRLARRRTFGDAGEVLSDDRFYPDGSRRNPGSAAR